VNLVQLIRHIRRFSVRMHWQWNDT